VAFAKPGRHPVPPVALGNPGGLAYGGWVVSQKLTPPVRPTDVLLRLPLVMALAGAAAAAAACPFCNVVGRPLAERRDAAAVVAVGEAAGAARDEPGGVRQAFVVQSVIRGGGPADETVMARVAGPVTGTALILGDEAGRFEAVASD
jgi:hypothetical protein